MSVKYFHKICLALIGSICLLFFEKVRGEDQVIESDTSAVWLVAFEEADFIKKEIGDWLPITVLKTQGNSDLRWNLEYIRRKGNECELAISFESDRKRRILQKYKWFDRGLDDDIEYGPAQSSDGQVFISVKESDGTTRRIWIKRSSEIKEFERIMKVSKSMLRWKWSDVLPVEL